MPHRTGSNPIGSNLFGSKLTAPRSRRLLAISGGVMVALMMVFGPATQTAKGAGEANADSPAMMLGKLGFKFNGAGSCKGSGCHDKAGDVAPPKEVLHEFNIWKNKDRHAKAFETLSSKESKAIGAKLKPAIADVKTSAKCLSCHSLSVPAPVQGAKFNIKEGNTCESCHGPSEKWLKDHATKGWQEEKRKAMDHAALIKTLGLFDTRPMVARAEMCASCHLSIDADLIAAEHPVPAFEMGWSSKQEPKHWFEVHGQPDGYINTKIWMAGQVVCVEEATKQLSARAKAKAGDGPVGDAWKQALAHATVFAPGAKIAGIAGYDEAVKALEALKPADGDKIVAASDALGKLVTAAKPNIEKWNPDAAATGTLFKAVCNLKGMGAKFDTFGMDQQGKSISTLYVAWASGSGKLDRAAIDTDANVKLLDMNISYLAKYPDKPPTAAEWDKAVADVVAKLPK